MCIIECWQLICWFSTSFSTCMKHFICELKFTPVRWTCCKKRTTDFSEFLDMPGCTRGYHTVVEPPKPVKEKPKPLAEGEVISLHYYLVILSCLYLRLHRPLHPLWLPPLFLRFNWWRHVFALSLTCDFALKTQVVKGNWSKRPPSGCEEENCVFWPLWAHQDPGVAFCWGYYWSASQKVVGFYRFGNFQACFLLTVNLLNLHLAPHTHPPADSMRIHWRRERAIERKIELERVSASFQECSRSVLTWHIN